MIEIKNIKNYPFLTGDGYSCYCRYSLNSVRDATSSQFAGLLINEYCDNNAWFVKTDYLGMFIQQYKKREPYILITHNSDYPTSHANIAQYFLNDPDLIVWYAVNVDINHPKIVSIPFGLENHEQPELLEVMSKNLPKNKLVYANYSIHTNQNERSHCLNCTQVPITPKTSLTQYLTDMAEHLFSLAPNGNGVDTYRLWESLYCKTIPIVTQSMNIDFYKNKLPMIVLSDWSEFSKLNLNKELYDKVWNNFDVTNIYVDNFIKNYLKGLWNE